MTHPTGIGLGLRVDMAEAFLEAKPEVAFVEVHPENYIGRGGRFRHILECAQESWPVICHGLTVSFGSTEAAPKEYLSELNGFLKSVKAPWYSDHLCFGGAHGRLVHDLLPLPFTQECVGVCVQRLKEVQDALDVPVAFENVSYYAPQQVDGFSPQGGLEEADFVAEVAERADSKILLDVNNVFVNSQNFGFDPKQYIDRVPLERVVQLHVAGHLLKDNGLRIDTHGEPVCDGVMELLEYTLRKTGPKPVLLERDNNIPALDELLAEVAVLNTIYKRAMEPS